jgi:CRP-like cAMP-binding protein
MPQPPQRFPPASTHDARRAAVVSIRDLKTRCATCSMRELCLPVGLSPDELTALDTAVGQRARLRKGEALYRAGDAFNALYAVRLGTFKTTVLAEDGREQIAGYHLQGDILGLDGLGTERHGCAAMSARSRSPTSRRSRGTCRRCSATSTSSSPARSRATTA